MEPHVLIFIIAILIFMPCTGVLLYVWHKYGGGERAVAQARTIFVIGVVAIIALLVTL